MTDCIPLLRQRNHGAHTGNLSNSNARTMLRRRHIQLTGPPPLPNSILRHTCINDSTMPNGFICQEHVVWGVQSENMQDQYGPIGKRDIEKQRIIFNAAREVWKCKPDELIDPCPACDTQRIRKSRCFVKGKLCKRCSPKRSDGGERRRLLSIKGAA